MRYQILKILVLFNFFIGFSQNKLNEKNQKHGNWTGYYPSKNLKYEGFFDNGKEKGIFKFYDDSAKQTIIATKDFSKKENLCFTTFFYNKTRTCEGWYSLERKKTGVWIYYHQGGDKINSKELYHDGKLQGEKIVYYTSGNICEKTNYKNGLKNGLSVMYSETGALLKKENFINGRFHGECSYYKSNGTLIKRGTFSNNKLQGNWNTKL